MKFNFYIKYFIAWVILPVLINYNTFINTSSKTNTSTASNTIEQVKIWEIKKSIEVVWSSELVDEQSLSFNKEWTITKVYFKAWDKVNKWDIIAELDNSDAYTSIEDAKISLENTKINLQQLYEWADESKILQSENSIITTSNSLEITKKEFENLKITQQNSLNELLENIETSKKELEYSKTSLELSKKELDTLKKEKENSLGNTESNKSTTIIKIEDDLKSNLVEIEKIIEESDYIMWVTDENKDKNDEYENYLWAKNKVFKNDAETSLLKSISMYKTLKISLEDYDYLWDKDKIILLLTEYLNLYNNLYETTDLVYKTVDNSIDSVWTLSEWDIDSMKNTMSSYRSSSLNKASSINSSINTLNTLTDIDLISEWNQNSIASKEESIKTSQLSIDKKELSISNSLKNYDSTVEKYLLAIKSKQNDIDSKETSLKISKISLEELLEWPTEQNVAKSQNSIKQAEIKLDSAYENLDDYKLEAPFDWVIRKIDYMAWDNITNDTDKYIYIENPNLLEVSVKLDQIDIVTVNIWDDAIITFDAYITTPVKAKISSIDTTPGKTSWVVSYEVKLILDDPDFDKKILSWMTADVEIINELKENILLLKTNAINTVWDKKIVNISKNWKQEQIEVTTGLTSDWMTEILSWLKEGENAIVWDFVISWEEDDATLFDTPWSWKWWWWWWGWWRPQ